MRRQAGLVAIVLLMGLVASACSGSVSFSVGGADVDGPAADLITGELTEEVGLGEQTPECDTPEDPELGDLFTCTGTLADGRVVEYAGEITEDETFSLETTNIVFEVGVLEADLHAALVQDGATSLSLEGVDCGGAPILVENDELTCTISAEGFEPLPATITIPDTRDGTFEWEVDEVLFMASGEGTISSSDFDVAARELIATELTAQTGLGEQTAVCDLPESPQTGDLFTCTGTLTDGRVINYEGVIETDGNFSLGSTNVIFQVQAFEEIFHGALLQNNPEGQLTLEGVDCGDEPIVLADDTFVCILRPDDVDGPLQALVTMPDINNGDVFEWFIE